MATITKLQKKTGVRYKAIIRKQGRILKTKTFTRKADAQTWANRIESDRQTLEALGTPAATMTLAQLADEYMQQWEGRDQSRPARVAFWVEKIGDKKLVDITKTDIRQILNRYGQGQAMRGDRAQGRKATNRKRSPATVNRMKAAISSLFAYAMEQDYIGNNPARAIKSKSEARPKDRYLSSDERVRLLSACNASEWPKLPLMVIMALTTGARLGELLKLRWQDIDFERSMATCRYTKNGDDRLLPLPASTLKELRKWREVGCGLVFPSVRKPGKPFEFRKHWDKALVDAEIENFRFHDLRHSAASYLVMAGATLHETAEILGHKSTQTTKRYAHLSTDHKAALAERVLGNLTGEGAQ